MFTLLSSALLIRAADVAKEGLGTVANGTYFGGIWEAGAVNTQVDAIHDSSQSVWCSQKSCKY